MNIKQFSRRNFIIAAAGGVSALALSGCGGWFGSGGGNGGGSTVNITLDPIFLASGPVQLLSGGKIVEVSDTGTAKLNFPKRTARMFTIFQPGTLTIIAMCYVDPTISNWTIDTKNFAATLIHQALGGYQYVGAARGAQFSLILSHTATATLAGVILTELQSDPLALTNSNAAIKSALGTALESFEEGIPAKAAKSGKVVKTRGRGEENPYYLSEPVPEFMGNEETYLAEDSSSTYIYSSPQYPESLAYSYMTGTATEQQYPDNQTPISPAEQLMGPVEVGRRLDDSPMPKVISPSLPMSQQFFAEYYKLVVLRPIFDAPDAPIFQEPEFQAWVPLWRSALEPAYERVPVLLFCMVIADCVAQDANPPTSILRQVVPRLSELDSELAQKIRNGRAGTNLQTTTLEILEVANPYPLIGQVIEALTPLVMESDFRTDDIVNRVLGGVISLWRALNIVSASALKGPIAKVHMSGDKGQSYSAQAVKADFTVQLSSNTYTPGDNITAFFNPSIEFPYPETTHYKCSTSGDSSVTLTDGTLTGQSIDTHNDTITIKTTPSTNADTIALTVEMWGTPSNGIPRSYGTQTVNIAKNGTSGVYALGTFKKLRPSRTETINVTKNGVGNFDLTNLEFQWTVTGVTNIGRFTSGNGTTITTTTNTVPFEVFVDAEDGAQFNLNCIVWHRDPTTGNLTNQATLSGTYTVDVLSGGVLQLISSSFSPSSLQIPDEHRYMVNIQTTNQLVDGERVVGATMESPNHDVFIYKAVLPANAGVGSQLPIVFGDQNRRAGWQVRKAGSGSYSFGGTGTATVKELTRDGSGVPTQVKVEMLLNMVAEAEGGVTPTATVAVVIGWGN